MAETIFYDLATDKAFREDKSEIANLNLPENIYKLTADFNIQLLNSQSVDDNGNYSDFYVGFVGKTVTSRAAVDNNFIITSTALLAVALSTGVPVGTITIKALGTNFNTTRPAGTINLSSTESVNYNAITADGDNWILQTANASFVTENYTPPADYAVNLALTSVELALIVDSAVDVTEKDTGLLVITNDSFNSVYQAEANGLEEIETCWQEFSVIEDAVTIMRKRFPVRCLGILDDDGGVAPAPSGSYYNKTESDSRYVRQALTTAYGAVATPAGTDKLFERQGSVSKYITLAQIASFAKGTGAQVALPNATTTNITLGTVSVSRAFNLFFTIDDGTNYMTYSWRMSHDDTNTTDDGGDFFDDDTEINGITITFDLSGGNVRMNINNTSGGALKLVWQSMVNLNVST